MILECGPMPNVMAALPNIGGALCSTPQSFAVLVLVPRSNAAKKRNPLKLAGVPQTNETMSAASGPTCGGNIAAQQVFFQLSIHVSVAKPKVVRWCPNGDFLGPAFPVRCMQHVSDLHSKSALGPHHVW